MATGPPLLSMFDEAHLMGKSKALTLYLISWERGIAKLLPAKVGEKTAGNTQRQAGKAQAETCLALCCTICSASQNNQNSAAPLEPAVLPQVTFQTSPQPPFLQERRCCHGTADSRLCTAAWHCATLLEISRAGHDKSST